MASFESSAVMESVAVDWLNPLKNRNNSKIDSFSFVLIQINNGVIGCTDGWPFKKTKIEIF